MMKTTYLLIVLLFSVGIQEGISQAGDSDVYSGTDSANRTTVKSKKISTMPQSKDSIMELPKLQYYLEPVQHEVSFEVQQIKPAKLKIIEPLDKLYSGYVKAAIGMYTTPYLEGYYNSMRSKKRAWGTSLLHHSSLGNIKNIGVNKFNDNHLGGYYKHFFKEHTLKTSLNYDRNSFHYYGFDATNALIPEVYRTTPDTIKQVYNLVSFHSELKSILRDSAKLNHHIGLDYNFLNGLSNTNEHNLKIGANLFKYMGKEEIGADVMLDFNALQQSIPLMTGDSLGDAFLSMNTNNAIFKATPYIFSRGDNWSVKAGLGIYANIGNSAKFHFYPSVEANYSLFNDIFIPYVGLSGGIKRNSFNSMRLENSFILENAAIQNTNQKLKVYGGIRGSISSKISFNLAILHEEIEGLPIFGIDATYSYGNKFTVLYDTLSRTTISGQLAYQKLEKIKVYGKGEYFAYGSGRKEFAWHKPDFKLTLSGTYDLADKILVRANVFVVGNRKTYSYSAIEGVEATNGKYIYNLQPFVDANLGFEYRYNKKLSAFVNFNNFAGKNYSKWTAYPVQGFNLLGGITLAF
jgi:hypothetical protein